MELENRVTIKLSDNYSTEKFQGDLLELPVNIQHVFSSALSKFYPMNGKYSLRIALRYPGVSIVANVSGKYGNILKRLNAIWSAFRKAVLEGDGVEA